MAIISWKDCYETRIQVFDRQHQALVEQVNLLYSAIRKKLAASEEVAASEVMGFLRGWLLGHIVDWDLQYGPYLESRGGRFIA